jgi:hypothetical protein
VGIVIVPDFDVVVFVCKNALERHALVP